MFTDTLASTASIDTIIDMIMGIIKAKLDIKNDEQIKDLNAWLAEITQA